MRAHTPNLRWRTQTMSETTMRDLRKEVARRLMQTLDGKIIDTIEGVKPRLPHMLGATPLDEVHDPDYISGTLIDPSHDFWDDYYKEVNTEHKSTEELITAIETLREQNLFRMEQPFGEEGGIKYCEVDDPDQYKIDPTPEPFETTCKSCGEVTHTSPSLVLVRDSYHLKVTIDCENCDYRQQHTRNLVRE